MQNFYEKIFNLKILNFLIMCFIFSISPLSSFTSFSFLHLVCPQNFIVDILFKQWSCSSSLLGHFWVFSGCSWVSKVLKSVRYYSIILFKSSYLLLPREWSVFLVCFSSGLCGSYLFVFVF